MSLFDMQSDDDRMTMDEAGNKGAKPSQSPNSSGPAGKATVGRSAMPKKDGAKDAASAHSTKRGQTTVGKSSGIKAPAKPKTVTPTNTKRGK